MEQEQIRQTLKKAFEPYRCVVDFPDFESTLQFRIFDENNNEIMNSGEIPISKGIHESRLIFIINKAKNVIKKKGYSIV